MNPDTFDPLNLDNRVSLNRTVLADHRAVDRRMRGKQAWDLLSSQALRRRKLKLVQGGCVSIQQPCRRVIRSVSWTSAWRRINLACGSMRHCLWTNWAAIWHTS